MLPFRCVLAILVCTPAMAADAPSTVFERVFGIKRTLPAAMVEATLALEPGMQREVDANGDGRIDELWYIDTSNRHTADPVLVLVMDRDGDMHESRRGDRDSDLYFFDHGATGRIDTVVRYVDRTGDNSLDAMGIFYDKNWPDDKDDLTVWWSEDIGGDNMLWFDVNGNYYQDLCQWRTHFAGDEVFYQFRLTEDDERWVNMWEDPFAFYDPDSDGNSEEVVRISAIGHEVKNLRYSVDTNNGAQGRNTRNFDFSITALPPEAGISTESWAETTFDIMGIETHPVLDWRNTKAFSKQADWGTAMLTWNEINSNTHHDPAVEPEERWEGVLNHASKHGDFPQVGGPPCSIYNNRVEVAEPPVSPLRLYYDPYDHRLHLPGASYGYLDIDYDLDGVVDAAYEYADTNGDGFLDIRRADLTNNGQWDFEWPLAGPDQYFDLTFDDIMPFQTALLTTVLTQSQQFMDAGSAAFESLPAPVAEVIAFFTGPLADYHSERQIGERIRATDAGARFYMDLARDRLFAALKERHGAMPGWEAIEQAYARGQYAEAANNLASLLGTESALVDAVQPFQAEGHTWTRRIPIVIDNRGRGARHQWPVSVEVFALRDAAADFNPDHCALVAGERWLDWREIPHQVDDWDIDGIPRVHFVADIPADAFARFYLYYEPEGAREAAFPMLTNAVLDTPAYVAWESEYAAFRLYTGQFDFFGKHVWRRLPKPERLVYPLEDVDYHAEQEWGMDVLHVGTTSGLGGVTLYDGASTHPVQNPAGEGEIEFEYRVAGVGPVRSAVEIRASNVVPDHPEAVVTMRCFAVAEQAHTEVQVRLPDALAGMDIAPGIMKLSDDNAFVDAPLGVIGSWGYHGADIGEIGMGLIAPSGQTAASMDLPHERRLRCETEDGVLRYWVIGEWRRGMQYPVAPDLTNWRRTLVTLAARLQEPFVVTAGPAQQAYETAAVD